MAQAEQNEGLKRKLGLFPVTNIVVANMIGTGIFVTSGLLLADLINPVLMIGLWLAAGIMAFFGAMCYGELGAAFPEAGGEYIFLSKLFHPMAGFMSGWVSFIVGFSAPIAAASIGFSEYFFRALPGVYLLGEAIGISDPQYVRRIVSVILILTFTLIHLQGIKFGSRVQNGLTLYKIILIVGILLLGFIFGKGDMTHFSQAPGFDFSFSGWKTIGLSFLWISFAYSGWNAATYIGSEIKKPSKNIPLSLMMGTGIVILLYVCLNVLFVYAIPNKDMQGVISIGGMAMGYLFGPGWESVFSLLVSFALFSSISAFIILGPRIYYAMAKNGHFFRFAARINPKTKVPSMAIIIQSLIAIVLVMLGTFEQILTFMGFSLGIFPILSVLGVFKLRQRGQSKFVMRGYPVVPAIYIIVGLTILCLAFFERPLESSIALGTIAAGIPAYFIFIRRAKSKRG